jgi:hypothetical protein
VVIFKRSKFAFPGAQVFAKHFDGSSELIRTLQRRKVGELAAFVEEIENREGPVILEFSLLFLIFLSSRCNLRIILIANLLLRNVIVEATTLFSERVEACDVFAIRVLDDIVSILPEPNKR